MKRFRCDPITLTWRGLFVLMMLLVVFQIHCQYALPRQRQAALEEMRAEGRQRADAALQAAFSEVAVQVGAVFFKGDAGWYSEWHHHKAVDLMGEEEWFPLDRWYAKELWRVALAECRYYAALRNKKGELAGWQERQEKRASRILERTQKVLRGKDAFPPSYY